MRCLIDFSKRIFGVIGHAFDTIRRAAIRFIDGPYADEIVRPKA